MIDPYLVTTVSHEAKTTKNNSGDYSFATATSLKAKVLYEEILFTSPSEGRQKTSKIQIKVNPSLSVSVGDRVTISGTAYIVGFVKKNDMFVYQDNKKIYLV